jgi:hypothetical protein
MMLVLFGKTPGANKIAQAARSSGKGKTTWLSSYRVCA